MAAMTRLRPVMMTILSTVLGALPLILGSGPGAEVRTAIGWVVFGGLGIATVFTLVLIPVIYSLLVPLAPSRVHAGIRLYRELCEAELATECRREYRRGPRAPPSRSVVDGRAGLAPIRERSEFLSSPGEIR
jgi:hypothetical protein